MNKSISQVLWSAAILMPAVLLFTAIADLPHVVLMTVGGYILSLSRRKLLVVNDRTIIYSIVVIVVTVVLMDMMFPFNRERFGYITMIMQPQYYTVGAFYAAIALTFFAAGKMVIGGAAAAAVYSLIASADVFNLNLVSTRLPAIGDLINKHFYVIYVWGMGLILFIIVIAFRFGFKSRTVSHRSLILKQIVLGALLIIIPFLIYGGFKLYQHYESEVRRWENILIRMTSRQHLFQRGRLVVFGRETNLHRTMSPEVLANQDQIIMRVIASDAPGYMRGKVYDEYINGLWKNNNTVPDTAMTEKAHEGMLTFKSFFIGEEQAEYRHAYQVYLDDKFNSEVLLLPGNMRRLDVIAAYAGISVGGAVRTEDFQKDGGYTVFTNTVDEAASYPAPQTDLPDIFVQMPQRLGPHLDTILASVPGLKDAKNDRERFNLLLAYFAADFTYSLSWQGDPGTDPVVYFLETAKNGHCELYAASLAMLLRQLNIPSRYVTGFICAEAHPSNKYFVARLGNAHAWVEAYDRDRKEWVMLEPTPPSNLIGPRGEWDTFSNWRDQVSKGWQQLIANLRRGHFANVIVDFFGVIFAVIWMLIANPVGVTIIVGLLAWYIYRRRHARKNRFRYASSREIIRLGKIYQAQATKWEKQLQLPPEPGRTPSELLQLMRQSPKLKPEDLERACNFIENYQRLRFSCRQVTFDEIRKLKQI